MHTVFTHNNAVDHVLLVDDAGEVVSAYCVDDETLAAYIKDGAQADNWDVEPHFGIDNPITIDAYGNECGRDGTLCNERREFYKVA